jgi:hypothetical protein
MTFEEWLDSVPLELTGDPLWRMEVFRLAVFAGDLAWHDASRLAGDRRTLFYEYSLGSAREARVWYYQGRYVLSEVVAMHRMKLLTGIIRLLLTIIPAERGYKLAEEPSSYDADVTDILNDPPMP